MFSVLLLAASTVACEVDDGEIQNTVELPIDSTLNFACEDEGVFEEMMMNIILGQNITPSQNNDVPNRDVTNGYLSQVEESVKNAPTVMEQIEDLAAIEGRKLEDTSKALKNLAASQKARDEMINDLKDQIYRFRKMILRDAELAGMSNEDHRHMLEFIKRRDAEGVENLVREHLLRGQAAAMKYI